MMVMITANTPSLKASMRPLVILHTPFFGLRAKREQPVTGPLPPNAHRLGFDAEFSEKTRACLSRVESSALCTKSLNAGCTTGQGSNWGCSRIAQDCFGV